MKLAALVILDLPVGQALPRRPYAFAVGVIVSLPGGHLGAGAGSVPLFRAGLTAPRRRTCPRVGDMRRVRTWK